MQPGLAGVHEGAAAVQEAENFDAYINRIVQSGLGVLLPCWQLRIMSPDSAQLFPPSGHQSPHSEQEVHLHMLRAESEGLQPLSFRPSWYL